MVKCPNCRAEIDDSKMFLHERFCFQNIKYCEKCQEGIIKEEFDEHLEKHKSKEIQENNNISQKERDELTLKRVESSKIGCIYCGFLLSFSEYEEHLEMCGARTTECKMCGKSLLYKNLDSHIKSEHNLENDVYKQLDSGSINNNLNSYKIQKPDLNELDLNKMSSSEQIAYAMALSEQQQIDENKSKEINSNPTDLKKKSTSFDLDAIDYEYEKQMYEEEMKKYK